MKAEDKIERGVLKRIERVVKYYRSIRKDTGLDDTEGVDKGRASSSLDCLRPNVFSEFQSLAITGVSGQGAPMSTPAQEAKEWLEKFRDWSVANAVNKNLTEKDHVAIIEFWTKESPFPILAEVARTLLSVQPSAAKIEGDFSSAGALLSSRSSRLDCAYVDMALHLHFSHDAILPPEQVER